MKISKIYKNEQWECYNCKELIKASEVKMRSYKEEDLSDIVRFYDNRICFVNKNGIIINGNAHNLSRSNLNKLLVCPICKNSGVGVFLFLNQRNNKKTRISNISKYTISLTENPAFEIDEE